MGRIGRDYAGLEMRNSQEEATHDPRIPSSLPPADGRQLVRNVAMAIIWVLGTVALIAWAFRL